MSDLSNVNWRKTQPLVKYVQELVPDYFPVIPKNHPAGRGVGGYVNRTTHTGGFSAHAEGRAADIYLDAYDLEQLRIGNALMDGFIEYSRNLGVDHIIWNGQIWSLTKGGPRPYTGGNGPHTNHVHVAFTRAGSQSKNAYLKQMLDEITLSLTISEIGYAFGHIF
ncbi:hypothetical protein [Spirosoma endophyticum]|uniref:ARB-07466-like C-terminal domain-containing protein n=1 Tax=Spirosoma endophyticum TaxID=662367 RepID=A0A1I2EWN4_9BACT|nr:hypothetical protein [Spirosoma endophyticum]SFE97123.1 hypothetical protein SAMN05216167_12376 [Spirosoma endophyticum]